MSFHVPLGVYPPRFFGIYLLLVVLGGHLTNEYFAGAPSFAGSEAQMGSVFNLDTTRDSKNLAGP